jgi:hypothetical protein
MLSLSANPDFKDIDTAKIVNAYYDINGENIGTKIDVYGSDALDQAIEMVLCTEPYERLFNVSLSSPLYQILFQNIGDVDSIMSTVFDQIEFWVPIVIDRANAEIEAIDSEHTLRFKIPYVSNNGRIIHTFNRIIGK